MSFGCKHQPTKMEACHKCNIDLEAARLKTDLWRERNALQKEVEQLRVQLAGCGVVALDGHIAKVAVKDQFGWSPAYQDVLNLRRKYEALLKEKV